jgi:uncharacterized membrane protein YeaQ/YmgE (transglycosylase-associated protein family)
VQILGLIAVGVVIGALARLLQPGRQRMSVLATMLVGVVGAVIGGLIADWLDVGSITELNSWGFVFALLTAVLLVGIAEGVAAGRNRAVR